MSTVYVRGPTRQRAEWIPRERLVLTDTVQVIVRESMETYALGNTVLTETVSVGRSDRLRIDGNPK